MSKDKVNGYALSRAWHNFAFDNPDKVSPKHGALFFFIIDHFNRMGWKEKVGLPASLAMDAIGVTYNTYKGAMNDLIEWGFVQMVEKSKNQYSANIIALSNFDKALDKALDKAVAKHLQGTSQSTCDIIKQLNNLTIEQKNKIVSILSESEKNKAEQEDTIEDEPVTFPDPGQHNETEIKATKAIAGYFGISEMNQVKHYMAIARFVRFQLDKGNLEYLRKQCSFYSKLKDKNPAYKHKWSNFIGSPEKKYEDGAWNDENWEQKYKDSQKEVNDGPNRLSYSISPFHK